MKSRLKSIYKDPFLVLIAVVVLVPAVLVVYGIAHQSGRGAASITSTTESKPTNQVTSQSTDPAEEPKPITQAEQSIVEEKTSKPAAAANAPQVGPTCDQVKKQTAEAVRNQQVALENTKHEKQKDKIRLVSQLYRKYWDEELTRHQEALNQIEATFRTAQAAANC